LRTAQPIISKPVAAIQLPATWTPMRAPRDSKDDVFPPGVVNRDRGISNWKFDPIG
jgi:hypothetical protein